MEPLEQAVELGVGAAGIVMEQDDFLNAGRDPERNGVLGRRVTEVEPARPLLRGVLRVVQEQVDATRQLDDRGVELVGRPRPMVGDVRDRESAVVDAVRITGVDGPVFHAELALSGPSGSHTVECRPSDALALALRQPLPVPIMVAEEVLAAAGQFPA